MKTLKSIVDMIAVVSLLLTVIVLIADYILEILASFYVLKINVIEIGDIFWTIVYVCFGVAVCFFVLAYFLDKDKT